LFKKVPIEFPIDRQVYQRCPFFFRRYEFHVQDGDVIIMATDGIFDNVPDSILVAEISAIQGSTDPAKIQVLDWPDLEPML
jgi:hypothetical protein